MNEFTDLTDAEYKVLQFIRQYNTGRKRPYTPSSDYIAEKLNKGRTTAFRIMANLRSKGINV
jgi:predicted transcriptional regulator